MDPHPDCNCDAARVGESDYQVGYTDGYAAGYKSACLDHAADAKNDAGNFDPGESARSAAYRLGYYDGLAGCTHPGDLSVADVDDYQRGYTDGDAAVLADARGAACGSVRDGQR